ncbi:MAG: L,D-transpeptidase family protein [Pseudomonadota bacterium]
MQPIRVLCAALPLALPGLAAAADPAIDLVYVDKSAARLYLVSQGAPVREYAVAFGANPVGHKQRAGDERTPEGSYTLDYKKSDSAFHKAIHISYPNDADRARARAAGVDPGGAIMIHGQRNGRGWVAWITQGFDWTDGCIAVTDREMDEIWELVETGTPIQIVP